jgi:peptidoglycan/xylan/chitin deacetylase (PgdA/CDA1 family)
MTFDDGPDPIWTPRVLRALGEADARATFFVVAPLAKRYPRLIREALGNGHRVELHCTRHKRHTEMSRSEVEEDTRTGLRELAEVGAAPELWRPPWGVCAPWTADVAREAGLEISLWSEDTHDWRGDGAKWMLDSIDVTLQAGSVVLMHDGLGPGARREGCEETVALVGPLVRRVRDLGCEPEPMTGSFAHLKAG